MSRESRRPGPALRPTAASSGTNLFMPCLRKYHGVSSVDGLSLTLPSTALRPAAAPCCGVAGDRTAPGRPAVPTRRIAPERGTSSPPVTRAIVPSPCRLPHLVRQLGVQEKRALPQCAAEHQSVHPLGEQCRPQGGGCGSRLRRGQPEEGRW